MSGVGMVIAVFILLPILALSGAIWREFGVVGLVTYALVINTVLLIALIVWMAVRDSKWRGIHPVPRPQRPK